MHAPETELKFTVDDPQAFHSAVAGLGLALRTSRTFESNTLFDTPDRQLRSKRQILRLREYGARFTVTHKRTEHPEAEDVRYKTRIETETEVEDPAAMAEIFCQLGFCPAFRYEKYRTEWDAGEGQHLVLDETPIGTWAELEGTPEWIDAMLARLGIAPERCTVASYGALFLDWKDKHHSGAENLTFEEIQPAMV